jgi:hypothetical protein
MRSSPFVYSMRLQELGLGPHPAFIEPAFALLAFILWKVLYLVVERRKA